MKFVDRYDAAIIALAVAAAVVLALVTVTRAHDYDRNGTPVSAEWIQRAHPECCGPQDCRPVPWFAIRYEKGRVRVQGVDGTIPATEVRRSKDEHSWACVDQWSKKLLCIFRPFLGNVFLPKQPLRMQSTD